MKFITEDFMLKNNTAKKLYHEFAEDLPIIYLVDPQWHVALSERVAAYEPYCGDYYIVNAELGL